MRLSSAGLLTIADDLIIGDGKTIGSASDVDAMSIAAGGAVTFTQTPVFPDGSLALADLDIDGGTDIGADIVDADLFIVDDGAGGTNRKTAASRLKTYIGAVNGPSFRAYQSTQQNIANGTATQINLQTEDWDTANAFASNTFTCPSDGEGRYIVVGSIRADASWAGTPQFNVMIFRNGASNTGGFNSVQFTEGSGGNGGQVSAIVNLASGDTLKLYLYHSEGGTEGLQTGQESTYFAGTRIST